MNLFNRNSMTRGPSFLIMCGRRRSKGAHKRGNIVEETLFPEMFPRRANEEQIQKHFCFLKKWFLELQTGKHLLLQQLTKQRRNKEAGVRGDAHEELRRAGPTPPLSFSARVVPLSHACCLAPLLKKENKNKNNKNKKNKKNKKSEM